MSAAIRWEDPPVPKPPGPARVTGPILDELENRPGEWAHVGTAATTRLACARAQTFRNAAYKRGVTIETAVRQVGKHVRLYARIVP